jgi:F420-non-reducing hydrogenase large subunit
MIRGDRVDEGLLNIVETAFRAYDPCFTCATHFAVGQLPLTVEIYDHTGKLVKSVQRQPF